MFGLCLTLRMYAVDVRRLLLAFVIDGRPARKCLVCVLWVHRVLAGPPDFFVLLPFLCLGCVMLRPDSPHPFTGVSPVLFRASQKVSDVYRPPAVHATVRTLHAT